MKKLLMASLLVLGMAASAQAVPVLQLGAPGGPGEGTYANYQASTTNPTENDTAITTGGTLYVAGVYQNNNVLSLGGKFDGGLDWSSFDSLPSIFNGKGAILVVSVPDGDTGTLTIPGATFITSSLTDSFFPNNHAPVQANVADFLFYDIGNFSKIAGAVPDFALETGAADGQIMTFSGITVTGYDWVHFDVMALETAEQGGGNNARIVTNWENNPGSHDVTWKSDDGGGGQQEVVPEPGTIMLLGTGLIGLALYGRRRMK
ncbi:choice-of-anchor N protein [Geobacter hydrogenophilus]|uniref:Ice-binding protein C-terminal domain-containing protein n=1 Tax=Geobacter hydrogenophilus TaxID=40983 RepID=A0A9W6G365_9BACT|nr:choice-of-anchor N protein [Geobacter hydrogenophilus]GLI40144.1 hypothetical protein GHYDROH2_36450 [Geobacter hydrogenophilus]